MNYTKFLDDRKVEFEDDHIAYEESKLGWPHCVCAEQAMLKTEGFSLSDIYILTVVKKAGSMLDMSL